MIYKKLNDFKEYKIQAIDKFWWDTDKNWIFYTKSTLKVDKISTAGKM